MFNDSGLASKIEDNFIPIQPTAKLNRMDHIKYCKILPTMLFFDENGNLVRKEEGKKTLFQTSGIIQNVIATNCTAKDEKINITSGTHKGSTCCEGLVKQEKAGEVFCTERVCIENSDRPVPISGDPRKLQCCDESKEIEILYKTFGTDVICREPRYHSNIIDESRENSKHEMPTNSPGENKNASPSVENE